MVKLIVKEWEVVVVVVVIISRLKLKQSEIVVKTTFTFDELQPNKTVGWNFHVATLKGYDMIIGRDMMSALGIDVLFSQERITWEGFDLPFKEHRIENIKENFFIPEPQAVASSEDRMGIQTPVGRFWLQIQSYELENPKY